MEVLVPAYILNTAHLRMVAPLMDKSVADSVVPECLHVLAMSELPRSDQDKIPCVFPVLFAFSLCVFIDKK